MGVAPLRKLSLTDFRIHASKNVNWVIENNAHIWLLKHGRPAAGVVPAHHMRALDRMMGKPMDQHESEMERILQDWRFAKLHIEHYELTQEAERVLREFRVRQALSGE